VVSNCFPLLSTLSRNHQAKRSPAGEREVDIHPEFAKMLLEFNGDRTSAYLFCAKTGKPFQYDNIRKNTLDSILFRTGRKL
jgi:hypothetical protein